MTGKISRSQDSLPDFEDPPVIEVAASIQFTAIPALDAARLGVLWLRFRDRYPRTEVQPALPRVVESEAAPISRPFEISVMGAFPSPRLWFLTEDSTRLVQVQNDRLVVNWRRLESDAPYPHYPVIRQELTAAFDGLIGFLQDEDLGTPSVDQAELTYVNHFWAGGVGAPRATINRFLKRAWEPAGTVLPPEPEEFSLRAQFAIKDTVPGGRVYVEVASAYRTTDRASIYSMNLTARGAPTAPTLDGALAFMDAAHGWIVNIFADLTTDEMHRLWRRRR